MPPLLLQLALARLNARLPSCNVTLAHSSNLSSCLLHVSLWTPGKHQHTVSQPAPQTAAQPGAHRLCCLQEPPKPVDLTFKIQEEVIKVDIRVEQVVKMSINVDQVDMAITVRETLPPVKPLHGTSLIQARRTASEPRQDLSQCGWLTSKIGNKSTIPTWAN